MIRAVMLALALCSAACELAHPAPEPYPAYARIDPPAPPAPLYTPPTEAERAEERLRMARLRRVADRIARRARLARRREVMREAYRLSLILN